MFHSLPGSPVMTECLPCFSSWGLEWPRQSRCPGRFVRWVIFWQQTNTAYPRLQKLTDESVSSCSRISPLPICACTVSWDFTNSWVIFTTDQRIKGIFTKVTLSQCWHLGSEHYKRVCGRWWKPEDHPGTHEILKIWWPKQDERHAHTNWHGNVGGGNLPGVARDEELQATNGCWERNSLGLFCFFLIFPLGNNLLIETALKLMYIEATPNDSVDCVCWGGGVFRKGLEVEREWGA